MFGMIKVRGDSMSPLLCDGDFVIIIHKCFKFKVGQVVVIHHALFGLLLKRISDIHDNGNLRLVCENTKCIQAVEMGWLPTSIVVGKVIYCIRAKTNTYTNPNN